jgi:hypothetical protein
VGEGIFGECEHFKLTLRARTGNAIRTRVGLLAKKDVELEP